jgi:hypothetical protein
MGNVGSFHRTLLGNSLSRPIKLQGKAILAGMSKGALSATEFQIF